MKRTVEIDDILTREQIAALLHINPQTVSQLVRQGRLPAFNIGTDKRPIYRFVRAACIAAMTNSINTQSVNAGDMTEEKPCQSNYVAVSGTVISLRQAAKELDNRLKQRTKGKLRNSTIN
ncbi:DNA-binding protein [Prodigiosinella confusarubida]|uniref:DNA-binding protein n=1 Tax=Serratia sp. (strain ATCC 39006) TaxID=104623 RepID=A0A2I5THJ2_SERS3|nr:DNA-binding protein [Serratia sp. ATCC 39006]AUH04032.1 DNA-binding protein [Serratia sp. ATCC 39006]